MAGAENRTIAEYSLRDMSKPLGVADYRLTTDLPAALQTDLPAPEDLERILQQALPLATPQLQKEGNDDQ